MTLSRMHLVVLLASSALPGKTCAESWAVPRAAQCTAAWLPPHNTVPSMRQVVIARTRTILWFGLPHAPQSTRHAACHHSSSHLSRSEPACIPLASFIMTTSHARCLRNPSVRTSSSIRLSAAFACIRRRPCAHIVLPPRSMTSSLHADVCSPPGLGGVVTLTNQRIRFSRQQTPPSRQDACQAPKPPHPRSRRRPHATV